MILSIIYIYVLYIFVWFVYMGKTNHKPYFESGLSFHLSCIPMNIQSSVHFKMSLVPNMLPWEFYRFYLLTDMSCQLWGNSRKQCGTCSKRNNQLVTSGHPFPWYFYHKHHWHQNNKSRDRVYQSDIKPTSRALCRKPYKAHSVCRVEDPSL